jgi:hypothetical protein
LAVGGWSLVAVEKEKGLSSLSLSLSLSQNVSVEFLPNYRECLHSTSPALNRARLTEDLGGQCTTVNAHR